MLHMVAAEAPPTIAISTITTTTCAKTLLLVLAMALPLIHFPFCPSSASGLVGDIPITLPLVLRIFRLFFGHWTADFSEFLVVEGVFLAGRDSTSSPPEPWVSSL